MQRKIKATPERLIAEATAFMVENGASVQAQTDTSATFVAREEAAFGLAGSLVGAWAMGNDAMLSAHTATNTVSENGATLVALPSSADNEETTVTIPDSQIVAANLLRLWFGANVLRESLPEPLMKFEGGSQHMLIWNNRLEVFTQRIVRMGLSDTIHMDDVASVQTDKRRLIVRATDGREVSMKTLWAKDAEKAEGIIQDRLAVHRTPSFVY